MPTIAIVGAGSNLGRAVAQRFGREGFSVALIARTQSKLDAIADELRAGGIDAGVFTADVTDPISIREACALAERAFDSIDVVQYSPLPWKTFLRPVLESTLDDFRSALQFSVIGAIATAQALLPGMRRRGRGSIVFVNGGTAVQSRPDFAGTSVSFPAESAYAEMLRSALLPEGITVKQIIIPGGIEAEHPKKNPEAIADRIWAAHTAGSELREFIVPMNDTT